MYERRKGARTGLTGREIHIKITLSCFSIYYICQNKFTKLLLIAGR